MAEGELYADGLESWVARTVWPPLPLAGEGLG